MKDFYTDGYETGYTWTLDYRPGGPFRFFPRSSDAPLIRQIALKTIQNNKDWMAGFDAGLIAQLKNKI